MLRGRKSGFTLIELLAVIVILAIIALIAVPIVLNIINDSKKSSNEESIKMYASALENAIGNYFIRQPGDRDITLEKLERYINYSGARVNCAIADIKTDGTVFLANCTVGDTPIKYVYGKPPIGDKYTIEYEVKEGTIIPFYVLSVNGDKINLIVKKEYGLCENGVFINSVDSLDIGENPVSCETFWNSENDNSYGPRTAMEELYEGTKDWSNVPDMIMNYTDEKNVNDNTKGYTSIITNNGVTTITGKPTSNKATVGTSAKPLKARLPKLSEVTALGCGYEKSTNCPLWLVSIVANTTQANWTLSSSEDDEGKAVAFRPVSSDKGQIFDGTISIKKGIRPVITVSNADLANWATFRKN